MTTACVVTWAVVILLLPLLILMWVMETKTERVKRWRRSGMTQQAIADRLGCSRTTVRRILAK